MSNGVSFIRFQILKKGKQTLHYPITRFYRDNHPDNSRSKLIAGFARSGTTWVADVVASSLKARIMFEPFNPELIRQYSKFKYYQYMRPEETSPELSSYCSSVFSGRIRNHWIDQQVQHLKPQYRIVKAVRANLMLGWLHQRFPKVQKVLVIRHPCAVFLSWKTLGWDVGEDLHRSIDHQPGLVEDFMPGRFDVGSLSEPEEKFALLWCIHHLVPLRQLQEKQLIKIFYESLCDFPEQQFLKIFAHLNLNIDARSLRSLKKPSTTSIRSSAVLTGHDRVNEWKNKLSVGQIDRVLEIVEKLGLGYLYGDSTTPIFREEL